MKVLIACEFSGIVRNAFREAGHEAWSCDIEPAEDNSYYHLQRDVLGILEGCALPDHGYLKQWDMMIAHPPCTYLSVSGLHWNKRGRTVNGRPRAELTAEALQFVQTLMDAPIPRIVIENPVSCISTAIRKPDQIVHPWFFGDDASKKTCLWLKGVPKLEAYYPKVLPPKGWSKVMCAADMVECEDCGEPFCPECNTHYADCECIRPTEEAHYEMVCGFMFAHRGFPIEMRWGNQTPSGQNKLGPSADRAKLRSKTYQGIANAMAEQWGAL
jgi:hypothetical protein